MATLRCGECGAPAKSGAGLAAHERAKHGAVLTAGGLIVPPVNLQQAAAERKADRAAQKAATIAIDKTAREKTTGRPQGATGTPADTEDRPPCLCGCGEFPKGPKSRFIQGHDARYHAALKRAAAGPIDKAVKAIRPALVRTKPATREEALARQRTEHLDLERQIEAAGGVGSDGGQAVIEAAGEAASSRRARPSRSVEPVEAMEL